jgi:DNA-binding CsgD family transcriptional regulator
VQFSAAGRQLMTLADGEDGDGFESGGRAPRWISEAVSRAFSVSGEHDAPPYVKRTTRWGEFTLRVYRLVSGAGTAAPLVSIHIEHREPLPLQVTRGALASGLSGRQVEICLLLAEGASVSQMATRLCVRPSTVVDHLRKIYASLGVHDRAAAIAHVCAAARGRVGPNAPWA